MKKNQDQPADALRAAGPTGRSAAELRRRAEERLKCLRPEGGGQRTDVETARLVHEPQINQIELEMQNEKLQQARALMGTLMARYIDLFDFAPMGYLTLDREGAIRQVNLNGARLFGVERSQLLKRRFGLFVAEGDRRAFSDFLEKVFASEAKECCEVTLPQEGFQPLVVHIEATCSADGQECHAAVLDMTERKRAEQQLRDFEALYHSLVEDIPQHVFRKDLAGRFTFGNHLFCESLGKPLAEILGKTDRDFFPAPLAAKYQQDDQRVVETGQPFEGEEQHRQADGKSVWVNVIKTPLRDAAGQIIGVQGISWDITERKRAEAARREIEERFRRLSEAAFEGILIHEGGVALSVNDQFCEMFGYQPDELLGKQVIPLTVAPESRDILRQQIATGSLGPYEVIGLKKDGSRFPMEIRARETEHEEHRIRVAVIRDITERKLAEERMQRFSREIIAAREEERKQVSAVLHHDVGSLTVGISAHLDAIEEDLRSGKPGEALKWMKRTRKLFDESVARLKKLAIELRPPELDVLGLRAALRQHFSHLTERGGTQIHFRETLGRRRVSGETATILFRIAQESLTNAITHGHATQVDVNLRTSKKEVTLTVSNNGKEFDPSEHRERATSQMGLRVMQEMAVSVGGTFTVDSGPGKRTTVRVRLPLKTAASGPGDVTAREETVARGKTNRSAGRGSRPQKGSGA